MRYQAVIFDLDGVIVSTDKFHFLAWSKITEQENIYFDEVINHQLRGISRKDSLEIILRNAKKDYSEEEKEILMTLKNDHYRKLLTKLTPIDISPNIVDVINYLQENKVKIAVASSSKNAKFILKQLGLYNNFDVIIDGSDIKKSKPNPEIFILASKQLNINPRDCLVVEDAVAGIQAAKAAGMSTFAVGEATKLQLADYNTNNLLDIIKLMENN